jgi:hypothetical protein
MPWSSAFEDPIALPDGRKLLTLEDAANYITKLPEAEHTAPKWQAAMECLILVAENSGPTMIRSQRGALATKRSAIASSAP